MLDAIEPRTKRVASIHEVLTSLVLSESCECYVPTSLGAARVAGYLWHRQGKTGSGWKRRFAACCANFIVLFNENDAPAATSLEVLTAKPVGALCFEAAVNRSRDRFAVIAKEPSANEWQR